MATPTDNLVPLTGNALIDGLTWGAAWDFAGGAHTLTYSLSLNDNTNGGAWSVALLDAVRRALAAWSNVANLSFGESGSGGVYDQNPGDCACNQRDCRDPLAPFHRRSSGQYFRDRLSGSN